MHGAGFATWNLDLIFGGAGERDADWDASLHQVLGLEHPPPHVERVRADGRARHAVGRGTRARHPAEESLARRYERTEATLAAAGYSWEEISNWARPGHECRHNHLYWDQGDYLGVGSAAHSHREGTRWWNVRTPERYVAAIERGQSAEAGREVLDEEQREFERLTLLLRTPRGVPWDALEDSEALERARDPRR